MNWFDHGRRAVSVVLIALSLIVVPAVATAKFTSTTAPTLNVGTDRMETPTGVSGTYRCIPNGTTSEGFSFSTNGFTDSGPSGATYKYSIIRAGNVVKTQTSTSKAVTVTTPNLPVDHEATPWTISIQTTLGNWTGTAYTKTITCAVLSSATGTF
jgi:hypothetical protein